MFEFRNLIGKAAGDEFMTEGARHLAGAAVLKRKALGSWGHSSIKTLDEMAQLLCDAKIASSLAEGKTITPLIIDQPIKYDSALSRGIIIDEMSDGNGNKKYNFRTVEYYLP